jgi:YVTN family beta-propeller protein
MVLGLMLCWALPAVVPPAPAVAQRQEAAQTVLTPLRRYSVGFASDDAVLLPREHVLVIAQEAGKRAVVLDSMTGKVLAVLKLPTGARHVAVDPALHQVYLPDEFSGKLAIFNYAGGWPATTRTLVGLGAQPHGVAVDPLTHRVYVGNEHGASLSVVDGVTRRVLASVPVGRIPGGVGMAPGAGLVYVVLVGENRVVVLDRAGKLLRSVPVGRGPTHLAVDAATGQAAVLNTTAGTLSLVNGAKGTAQAPLPVGPKPYVVVYDPGRALIVVGSAGAPQLTLVDGRRLLVRATVRLDIVPGAMAIDPGHQLLFVGAANRHMLEVFSYTWSVNSTGSNAQ